MEASFPDPDDNNTNKENDDDDLEISYTNLVTLGFITNIGSFLYGYDFGSISWVVTTWSRYESDDDKFKYFGIISDNDALLGIIASATTAGAMITYLFLLIFGNEISKRDEIILSAMLFFVGAFLESWSAEMDWATWHGIAVLLAGRLIYGAGAATNLHSVPEYLSLASPHKLRASVCSSTEALICTGIATSFVIGYAFEGNRGWFYIFMIAYILAAIMFVLCSFLPHSSRYLVVNNHPDDEILESLRFIYPTAGRADIDKIRENITQEGKDKALWEDRISENIRPYNAFSTSFLKSLPSKVRVLVADKYLRQGLLIVLCVGAFTQLSGTSPILYYAGDIFDNYCPDPDLCIVGVGIAKLTSSYSMLLFGDSFGRREILMCGLIIRVGALAIAAYGFEADRDDFVISGIYGSIVGFEISVGCLIWVLLNELFPPYVRSAANSIGVFNYLAFSTVASILFPYFHTWMGYYGTFVFYAVAALICLIVIYLYVPDARGVDLEVSYKLVDKSCKKTNSALTCEVYDDNEDSIEIRHNERSSLLDKNE